MSLWVGATSDTEATIATKLHVSSTDVRLVYSDGSTVTTSGAQSTDSDLTVKFALTGLAANTAYTYQIQLDGEMRGPIGRFKTHPAAAGTACSYTVAFAGDALSNTTAHTFDKIRLADPLMFLHLGDLHYQDVSTNSPALFQAAYDRVHTVGTQGRLYREIATAYVWDDHDYGANNSDGSSASKPAAAAAYRSRVPHYALPDATQVYHTFDIGRVRYIVTDQRSEASANAATDNSSKTMLGATQKTWFKNLLSSSSGKLIVWVCPRWFRAGTNAGADDWSGFTTERTEIADHIKANCPGRVVVISADLHTLAIDDGTNFDFATGGGGPLKVFQAAALDQTPVSGGGTYSHGEFTNVGQYGTMEISDSGGSSISVTWRGFDKTGATLVTYAFSVSV